MYTAIWVKEHHRGAMSSAWQCLCVLWVRAVVKRDERWISHDPLVRFSSSSQITFTSFIADSAPRLHIKENWQSIMIMRTASFHHGSLDVNGVHLVTVLRPTHPLEPQSIISLSSPLSFTFTVAGVRGDGTECYE